MDTSGNVLSRRPGTRTSWFFFCFMFGKNERNNTSTFPNDSLSRRNSSFTYHKIIPSADRLHPTRKWTVGNFDRGEELRTFFFTCQFFLYSLNSEILVGKLFVTTHPPLPQKIYSAGPAHDPAGRCRFSSLEFSLVFNLKFVFISHFLIHTYIKYVYILVENFVISYKDEYLFMYNTNYNEIYYYLIIFNQIL